MHTFQNHFVLSYIAIGTRNCAVNMGGVDLDSWEIPFDGESVVLYTWMEAIGALESHNTQR